MLHLKVLLLLFNFQEIVPIFLALCPYPGDDNVKKDVG